MVGDWKVQTQANSGRVQCRRVTIKALISGSIKNSRKVTKSAWFTASESINFHYKFYCFPLKNKTDSESWVFTRTKRWQPQFKNRIHLKWIRDYDVLFMQNIAKCSYRRIIRRTRWSNSCPLTWCTKTRAFMGTQYRASKSLFLY